MAKLTRHPLLWGETPLMPLPRLAKKLGVASVWMKRDDLTGIAFGGNKVRKLEYLLGHALQEDCDLIITGGSPGSNHCRLTVAVANHIGLDTWLCFSGNKLGEVQGNLFLDQLLGAKVFLTGCYGSEALLTVMEEKAEEARKLGRKPYVIPVGGSTNVGDYGYFHAWHEYIAQLDQLETVPNFDEIYVTVGTGGTMAGLLAGQASTPNSSRIVGVSVWQDQKQATQDILHLTNDLLREIDKPISVTIEDIHVFDQYIGQKYGVPSAEGNRAIRMLAELEGLFVDPIYTGKALAGMIDQLSQTNSAHKHVLFWHTGGTPALFTHVSSLLEKGER
ncbi:1-aminocyclopropane-1-carboxylate deaminase/D-cysteine desulfhydrase [Thermoflavimicrobium daqui]|nr:D-cysteine desulfhydrase family protein [Thermoflavimicrobium daqui]